VAVAGEGEPEEADGEEPDGYQIGDETGFGAALAVVREAVTFVEVGLWVVVSGVQGVAGDSIPGRARRGR
jgi:hypothetical protein